MEKAKIRKKIKIYRNKLNKYKNRKLSRKEKIKNNHLNKNKRIKNNNHKSNNLMDKMILLIQFILNTKSRPIPNLLRQRKKIKVTKYFLTNKTIKKERRSQLKNKLKRKEARNNQINKKVKKDNKKYNSKKVQSLQNLWINNSDKHS